MPLNLSDHVVAGEIINRRPNMTHGWIALRGNDRPLLVQLTGNPSAGLVGKRFRFSIPDDRPPPTVPPLNHSAIAWQQIGPTGPMSIETAASGQPHVHLEWSSQNGDVLIDLDNPDLEWVEDDEADARRQKELEAAEAAERGEDPDAPPLELGLDGLPDDDEDDPYGLFPEGLDEELASEAADLPGESEQELSAGPPQPRDWSEVIPGIDDETKKMYEEWDEVTYGTKDVPLSEVFDPPIKIYSADQLRDLDSAAAEAALKELLKRLALLGVALAVCEHYTPQMAYRYLAEEILPEYGVHPRLPQIGWVQHYDTSEECPECQARFDREWEAEHGKDGDQDSPEAE
jgi:hypothetical protein